VNAIVKRINVFQRLDDVERKLASTTALGVSINEAVDRLQDWVTTADGVIINVSAGLQKLIDLSENVQKTVNPTADRLEQLNDRVTRLSDEMMMVGGKLEALGVDLERTTDIARDTRLDLDATTALVSSLVARIEKLENPAPVDESKPSERDERRARRRERNRKTTWRTELNAYVWAAGATEVPVIETDILRSRSSKDRPVIRRALEKAGFVREGAGVKGNPYRWSYRKAAA
jgi:chromosome segregation ATPase